MTPTDLFMGRLFRFHVVGLFGACVQVVTLAILTRVFGIDYLIATALAVETAVIHNFFWHEQWTWNCRVASHDSIGSRLKRFFRFNLVNGLFSIVTNVIVTRAFVEVVGLPYLSANMIAIGIGSIATYLTADLYVFRAEASKVLSQESTRCGDRSNLHCQGRHVPPERRL